MKLNKYIAHCGVCSRRKAVDLIKAGKVKVNGSVVLVPYHEIGDSDVVEYDGKKLAQEEDYAYILLNKPKNTLSTVTDDRGRKTVLDIVHKETRRIYPVGRLDRNTTGLLLLTNDGDLAHQLTHPSKGVKKIYHVLVDQEVSEEILEKLRKGVELEDGFIKPDVIERVRDAGKNEIGIELHSGRNRIIRRMMQHIGLEVVKLDRVYFGGLTKKDIPRGRYRHLTKREIIMLRHFN